MGFKQNNPGCNCCFNCPDNLGDIGLAGSAGLGGSVYPWTCFDPCINLVDASSSAIDGCRMAAIGWRSSFGTINVDSGDFAGIKAWVEAGGRLVVSGGAWPYTTQSQLTIANDLLTYCGSTMLIDSGFVPPSGSGNWDAWDGNEHADADLAPINTSLPICTGLTTITHGYTSSITIGSGTWIGKTWRKYKGPLGIIDGAGPHEKEWLGIETIGDGYIIASGCSSLYGSIIDGSANWHNCQLFENIYFIDDLLTF